MGRALASLRQDSHGKLARHPAANGKGKKTAAPAMDSDGGTQVANNESRRILEKFGAVERDYRGRDPVI